MDDWWGEVEREVLACLEGRRAVPVSDVAKRLGVSESAAASLLALLAGEGKVRICAVERPTSAARRPE